MKNKNKKHRIRSSNGPRIWTLENRLFLFKYLNALFGPFHTWADSDGVSIKPTGREKEYDQAMKDLSRYFSEVTGHHITPMAVDQQKKWGCTDQPEITNQGNARTWILNRTAAYDAGFCKIMPKHIVMKY